MFNSVPKSERKRVSFIGRTNVGKSSLINAITNQKISIVSEIAGTTTDHTEKAIEILPAGPLVLTDTPGIDDKSLLSAERIERTREILRKSDFIFFVFQPPYNNLVFSDEENEYINLAKKNKIPFAFIFNKTDIELPTKNLFLEEGEALYLIKDGDKVPVLFCSAKDNTGISEIKRFIGRALKDDIESGIFDSLVEEGDTLMLVIPINRAYPKGRLKPLQVQIIREALERHIKLILTQPEEIEGVLTNLKELPKLIITDAQVLKDVIAKVPQNVALTSFSVLFANYKGDLDIFVEGLNSIEGLSDGDCVAIIEACTHHSIEGDMSRELLPEMIAKKTGKKLKFKFISGISPFWENLYDVKLALHCGGCMLTRRDMLSRLERFKEMGIPVINYGIFISSFLGIEGRALEPFRERIC